MEKVDRKYGWELVAKNFSDLNKTFKIENGKITAWYCHESEEWIYDSFKCTCGAVLSVSQFHQD